MAISNVMERTRLSLAHLGKLTFQQLTELINPSMNSGLPANLAATDPSLNFMDEVSSTESGEFDLDRWKRGFMPAEKSQARRMYFM